MVLLFCFFLLLLLFLFFFCLFVCLFVCPDDNTSAEVLLVAQALFLLSQCSLPLFPPLSQSEHEKLLRRQMKKEEKKEEKKARKDHQVSSTIEDHTSHLKSLGFDPNELWKER